jgi:hypothetical protein
MKYGKVPLTTQRGTWLFGIEHMEEMGNAYRILSGKFSKNRNSWEA